MSTSRSSARQRAAASLIRRSPSRSPRSMLNALRWSRSSTRDGERDVGAAGAGELARQLVVNTRGGWRGRSAGRSARARRRARAAPACSIATAAWEARSRASPAARRARRRRRAPDQDQHAGDLVVAQHRLEQRGARAGRLDQRRGERRVGAGVGDEVGLARGEARGRRSASGRGWIVTGAMSTPPIAVETNSRPDGSSRKATGAAATSQAARQTARRASSPPASARTTRPSAPMPRAWSRSVSLTSAAGRARGLALELVGEHAGEHREELLVGVRGSGRRCGESAASAPTREPSDSSSGTPR